VSRVVRRRWIGELSAPSRRERSGCDYEAYVPDPLAGRRITLDGDVAADVTAAEAAIIRLNSEATTLVETEALARILLRAESVASSRIEGLEIGPRRLLRAEAARGLEDQPSDVTAAEVLANIDAMVYGVETVGPGDPITVESLLDIHRRLLAGSPVAEHGGCLREVQNWIGGSDWNPCSASFVPPPHELVPDLVSDLVEFCNDDSLPAVAQAAIAHAQFETIHPFVDGNGRTGRALIHLVLRSRRVVSRINPPISLILATWATDYVGGLTATRYRGPSSSSSANAGLNLWVGLFAGACIRSVEDASNFESQALSIEAGWRERVGRIRARSAADRLLRLLVGAPVVTVNSASEMIGRSFVQTNEAVDRLVAAGVLQQITIGRRNRAFEAPEIVDAFTSLERRLASPEGDTRTSEPVRRVPRRPARQG